MEAIECLTDAKLNIKCPINTQRQKPPGRKYISETREQTNGERLYPPFWVKAGRSFNKP